MTRFSPIMPDFTMWYALPHELASVPLYMRLKHSDLLLFIGIFSLTIYTSQDTGKLDALPLVLSSLEDIF